MTSIRARFNHRLLVWARESTGLTIAQAAKKIGGARLNPERLQAWEAGETQPTVAQLRKIARVYKRPLAMFFLSEFPRDFTIPRDFRRLPGDGLYKLSPALRLQLRRAVERREIALELYEDLAETPPEFSLAATPNDEPEELGQRIRTALGVTLEEQFSWRDAQRYKPLNQWRRRIEESGVLVFQFVDVDVNETLGFSLAETIAPVIAVNRKLRPNGRIFTMMHEFTHLMLHQGGLCDIDENLARPPEEQRIEVLCNRAAAATLVPAASLLMDPLISDRPPRPQEWDDGTIQILAHRYSVSREVIVRRMVTIHRTTDAFYLRKRAEYQAQFAVRQGQAQPSDGFESPATRAISIEGPTYIRLILECYQQGHITLSDVSDYLGVRLKHLPKIEQAVLAA